MKRVAKRSGVFDSEFEANVAHNLRDFPFQWQYNTRRSGAIKLEYNIKKTYHPDFIIYNRNRSPLYVECKGWFRPSDRTKMLAVKEANPDAKIVLVFQHDNWLTKAKKQRYSDWARKHGFAYSIGFVSRALIA